MNIIDSIELGTIEGFDIRADIVPDPCIDLSAEPCDSNEEELLAAYRSGEWSYVTGIVTASKAGIVLGSDSISELEYGNVPFCDGSGKSTRFLNPLDGDTDTLLNGYGTEMINNAIADARLKLTELVDAAIDGSMGGNL